MRAALSRGDPFEALRTAEAWMLGPGAEAGAGDAGWVAILGLLAPAVEELFGVEVAGLVRDVAGEPRDPDRWFRLGHELVERRRAELARGVLARGRAVAPDHVAVVAELVAALELVGDRAGALAVLRGSPAVLAASPLCRYLLGFNALLAGDLDEPRRVLTTLGEVGRDVGFMADRLRRMLARAEGVGSVGTGGAGGLDDARLWTYVVTGGLLLEDRHGELVDSYPLIATGLARLASVMTAPPARVLALPDPDSRRLAPAVAAALSLPLAPWIGSDGVGLVVAYDLGRALPEIVAALRARRPGQVVFSHLVCRAAEHRVAPDYVTATYTTSRAPWAPPPDELGFSIAGDVAAVSADEVVAAVRRARAEPAPPALLELAAAAAAAPGHDQRERCWIH